MIAVKVFDCIGYLVNKFSMLNIQNGNESFYGAFLCLSFCDEMNNKNCDSYPKNCQTF